MLLSTPTAWRVLKTLACARVFGTAATNGGHLPTDATLPPFGRDEEHGLDLGKSPGCSKLARGRLGRRLLGGCLPGRLCCAGRGGEAVGQQPGDAAIARVIHM